MIQLIRRQKTGTSEFAVSTTFNAKQCLRLVTIPLWKVTSLRVNRWKTNFKETWSIERFSNDWSNDLWIITDTFLHGIRFVHVARTQAPIANAFYRAKLIKRIAISFSWRKIHFPINEHSFLMKHRTKLHQENRTWLTWTKKL